jgi:multisubunit Na+/H+ antiporter MnhG subunit
LLFFSAALSAPYLLKGLYITWMHIAFILTWINTKIILAIIFYIIFTPIGLFMRLLKFDLLERKKSQDTYWKQKDKPFDPLNYERRF